MIKPDLKFSILIVNWNGIKNLGELFDKCLESIVNTTYKNFEVIFIDNASTDGSYEQARSKFNFRFFRNQENLGFAGGNNAGARLCEGDIIVLLNTDTIVDPDWLNEPSRLFRNLRIGIVQANLRMLNEPCVPDSTGHVISSIGLPIENIFFMDEPAEPFPTFGAKGAAFFIRRELFERLEGLDEDYFYYFEESDLCWRAHLLDYEVYFSPHSIVLHKGGGTFKDKKLLYHRPLYRNLLYHRQKNTIASMIKCYEPGNLIKYLSLRLVFELAGIVYLLFKEPTLAMSNIKAIGWIIKNLGKLLRKRKNIQKMRIVADRELFERGLINKSLKLTFEHTKNRLSMFEAA